MSWEFCCCKLNVGDLDVVVRQRSDFVVSSQAHAEQLSHKLFILCPTAVDREELHIFFNLVELDALQHNPPECFLTKQTVFCITCDLLTMLVNCKYS